MQSIPLKKGEIVIWNTKNMINKMEMTQYIKRDHYGTYANNTLIYIIMD